MGRELALQYELNYVNIHSKGKDPKKNITFQQCSSQGGGIIDISLLLK